MPCLDTVWLQRSVLPDDFEYGASPGNSSVVFVDWDALREVSARRFPGFGKPMDQNVASSTKVSTARISSTLPWRIKSSTYEIRGVLVADDVPSLNVFNLTLYTSLANQVLGAQRVRAGYINSWYAVKVR